MVFGKMMKGAMDSATGAVKQKAEQAAAAGQAKVQEAKAKVEQKADEIKDRMMEVARQKGLVAEAERALELARHLRNVATTTLKRSVGQATLADKCIPGTFPPSGGLFVPITTHADAPAGGGARAASSLSPQRSRRYTRTEEGGGIDASEEVRLMWAIAEAARLVDGPGQGPPPVKCIFSDTQAMIFMAPPSAPQALGAISADGGAQLRKVLIARDEADPSWKLGFALRGEPWALPDMQNLGSTWKRVWEQKEGGIMTELMSNLRQPPDVDKDTKKQTLARLVSVAGEPGPSGEKLPISPMRVFLLTLYSMEGINVDAAMGYEDAQEATKLGLAKMKEYRSFFQDKKERNPPISENCPESAFPPAEKGAAGGAPRAPFRVFNWAARQSLGRLAAGRHHRKEDQVPEAELKRWIKTLVAIGLACGAPVDWEWMHGSLGRLEAKLKEFVDAPKDTPSPLNGQQISPDDRRARLPNQLARIEDARKGVKERTCYRGLGNMTPEMFSRLKAYRPGARLPLCSHALSTSLSKAAALTFLDGDFRALIELKGITHGQPLWPISSYPLEAEVLVPPLTELAVCETPVEEGDESGEGPRLITIRVQILGTPALSNPEPGSVHADCLWLCEKANTDLDMADAQVEQIETERQFWENLERQQEILRKLEEGAAAEAAA
eukprot:TRINITY_DN47042_c0_g1_i1.p1 TRINITY_DN47042_c0_g1~~TRINITY_DN47042_c0_g1_i1.p1  ORF type:complete len:668 (+),score=185.77 TRINITY_DN47042_c0_g1_i1:70-2073(+)